MVYLIYIDLTPGLENIYCTPTHRVIWETLNEHFLEWHGFLKRKQNYNLGFSVVTKRGVTKVEIRGPDIYRRKKDYEYAIYLPDEIKDLSAYIDFVFEGIKQVLSNFEVNPSDVDIIKFECRSKLALA